MPHQKVAATYCNGVTECTRYFLSWTSNKVYYNEDNMAEVFELKRDKHFTLQEARSLLPVVKKITQEAVEQMDVLKERIEAVDPEPAHRPYYEQELSKIVERWSQKILKLGCEPKGLWLVDFDNGHGYYCWHHPEEDVEFFHSYESGFTGRTPIL